MVTILVPAKNERSDIARCLEAVLGQDYPHDRLEVLVVDSGDDGTAAVAAKVLEEGDVARWEVVANPGGNTPGNLNHGLARATGSIICRVDARAVIAPHHVRTCVDVITTRADVSVVGGSQVPVARSHAPWQARVVARALANPYVVGGAKYRRGGASGPADTVYLGAFRADDLRRVGGWNERFATNQDFELNRRLASGGVVWFEAALPVEYLPRGTVAEVVRQYRRFGRWKAAAVLEGSVPLRPRQLAALCSVPAATLVAAPVLRRHPAVGTLACVAGLVALDAGVPGRTDATVRLAAGPVGVFVALSWWAGFFEQTARHLRGERLLGPGV